MKRKLTFFFAMAISQSAFAALNCWDYSTRAVRQNQAAVSLECGYSGARWGSNWQNHFDWCANQNQAAIENEDDARQIALKSCLRRPVNIDDCPYYATRAIRQIGANTALRCGFSGARWTNNRPAHLNWCNAQTTWNVINNEDRARRNLLTLCVDR